MFKDFTTSSAVQVFFFFVGGVEGEVDGMDTSLS